MAGVRSLCNLSCSRPPMAMPAFLLDFLPLLRRRSPPVTTCQRSTVDLTLSYRNTPLALGTSFDDFDDGAAIMAFEQTDSIVETSTAVGSSMRRQEFIGTPVNGGTSSMGRHVGLRFLVDPAATRSQSFPTGTRVWVKCHRAIHHDVGVRSHCWGSDASALECSSWRHIAYSLAQQLRSLLRRRRDRLRAFNTWSRGWSRPHCPTFRGCNHLH